ncbi:MAG: hypothetical protein ACLQMT_09915 [Candidatus Acidiferrales bacterium]
MKKRKPVWRKRRIKLPNFGGFMRRHNKMLTVLGACIVFLTFITKEGLTELARQWSNSLESGEEAYYNEKQISDMAVEIGEIHAQGEATWRRLYGAKPEALLRVSHGERLRIDGARLRALIMRLRSMAVGIQELQDPQRIPGAEQLLDITDETVAQLDLLPEAAGSTSLGDSPELLAIEGKTAELQNRTDTLGDQLVSEEQQQSLAYENAYELFFEISYLLYALGWALALVGRLYADREPGLEAGSFA